MSKDEKRAAAERIAEKFQRLKEPQQSFIAGYIARVEEEYAYGEKEPTEAAKAITA